MTATANFSALELVLGAVIALFAQLGGFALLKSGGGTALRADISDEHARPMSVAITPIVDDAPLLKLGSKRQPGKLPDRWIAPRPVERTVAQAVPSPHALATPSAIPTISVADAGHKPAPNAEIVKQADLLVETAEAGPAPVSTVEGAADGVKEGTETDPAKAHAVDFYRSQLERWFYGKFAIKGKVPFDTLKTLRASVTVNISGDRTVTSFTITRPSGDSTFDDELRATLASIVSNGAELPSPPPNYPDILQSTLSMTFRCTLRSVCE